MFSKRYITFKQTIDDFAKKGVFSGIQNGDGLIRNIISKYSLTHKPKKTIIFILFKYFIFAYMIGLVLFSLNSTITSPNSVWIKSRLAVCTVNPKSQECKGYENAPEKEYLDYRITRYETWILYTNILYFILLVTYLPYTIYSYYEKIRLGDISIFYGVRRVIYSLLLIGSTGFTWWFGAFIGSIYTIVYVSYMPIIYETFGTFTIPWIL